MTRLGGGVGLRIEVENLHQMLIGRRRLAERVELNESRTQMRLGCERTNRVVTQVPLIHGESRLWVTVADQPVGERDRVIRGEQAS